MERERTRLYLITPPRVVWPAFTEQVKAAFDGGDVACLQIRLKDENYIALHDDEQAKAVELLKPLCEQYDVALILNDNPELAVRLGCDGAHIGADDMAVEVARRILKDKVLGVSCYASKDTAYDAADGGADYVAFGQFYESTSKPARGRPELALLSEWQETVVIPAVAIGGIKVENCAPLIKAGADFIAVITGVWDYPNGVQQAVKDFNAVMEKIFRETIAA